MNQASGVNGDLSDISDDPTDAGIPTPNRWRECGVCPAFALLRVLRNMGLVKETKNPDCRRLAGGNMQVFDKTYKNTFALLSGGDHSLVATHYAIASGLADRVVHVDTGIGVSECKEFVQDTCSDMRVPLRIMSPPEMQYEDLVLKYGFPGPAMHSLMYRWLKERAIRQLVRESKDHRMEEVGLISGVHNQESARRMGYTMPRVKVGSQIWLAPLFNFNAIMFEDYKRRYSLPTSPVKSKLGFSGECLCGAFASPGEIMRIEQFYPKTAQKIHDLEIKAKQAGKHCVWGVRPKRMTAQYDIPFRPMCSSCPTKPPITS